MRPLELKPQGPRKAADLAVKVLATAAALTGLFFLGWILLEVVVRGAKALDWAFFTELPPPPGAQGGGLANAILGTLMITLMAVALGVPVGIMAGVYLAEFGKESRLAQAIRFSANVMMGIPSILVGLFVYALLVVPMRRFSGLAGAVSLAIIMMPIVARTTEDMLALVPDTIRESGLALGAPRWRVTLGVVFRGARTGLLTGVLLAVARVSGETAPLLFTAMNSPYWPTYVDRPMANLTVTIFNYAMSPYPNWQDLAWGASLVIMLAVLGVTLLTRFLFGGRKP